MKWLDDLRYRRRHRREATDDSFRLVRLTDNPWPDYNGYRSWCDGRLRDCRVCGGRCCDCQHSEARTGSDHR